MNYGFIIPGAAPREFAELAREAEEVGWDGVFVPDCVPGTDPWVVLATIAMSTERVRIGTMLTPVARRRPWKLASEVATLDHISGGRVILSVGLGALNAGFEQFGERTESKVRAELLDEGDPAPAEASMAKLYATETAKEAALQGMQFMGGMGYSMECDMQSYVRDSLVMTIFGGTSQIQKNIIADRIL